MNVPWTTQFEIVANSATSLSVVVWDAVDAAPSTVNSMQITEPCR
jgi:hypothetical protein